MDRGAWRWVLSGLLVVVVVGGFLIANSGSSDNAPKNAVVTIQVKNAKPVGGVRKIKVKKGGHVHLTVSSDVADEIHIHGYDYHKDVKRNGSVTFDFAVPNDGSFEIELESRKQQIADLQVEP